MGSKSVMATILAGKFQQFLYFMALQGNHTRASLSPFTVSRHRTWKPNDTEKIEENLAGGRLWQPKGLDLLGSLRSVVA
jgi:hypothetical protein